METLFSVLHGSLALLDAHREVNTTCKIFTKKLAGCQISSLLFVIPVLRLCTKRRRARIGGYYTSYKIPRHSL